MTNSSPTAHLHLVDLTKEKKERPGWSLTFGTSCAEAAAICLEDQGHQTKAVLQIDGMRACAVNLEWNATDDTMRRFNADQEVATEYGAYGIAALIMPYLTNLTIIERSIKGKGFGFDFWLGDTHNNEGVFQRKARLEVSGIRRGAEATIQSRVKIKLKQIDPSDAVAPGYVSVVEFGTPKVCIVKKCRT